MSLAIDKHSSYILDFANTHNPLLLDEIQFAGLYCLLWEFGKWFVYIHNPISDKILEYLSDTKKIIVIMLSCNQLHALSVPIKLFYA